MQVEAAVSEHAIRKRGADCNADRGDHVDVVMDLLFRQESLYFRRHHTFFDIRFRRPEGAGLQPLELVDVASGVFVADAGVGADAEHLEEAGPETDFAFFVL